MSAPVTGPNVWKYGGLGSLYIQNLSPEEQSDLNGLVHQIETKSPRNKVRSDYYDCKYLFEDLGISIPPKLCNSESVLGWAAKAVGLFSGRCTP